MVKVSCIVRHQGVQVRLAYNWARSAVLVAGKVAGGGVARGGGGGVTGVIVVRVCEPVFQKTTTFIYLAFEKTDPFIYLIIQNVDLFIYCPLIFEPIYCWLLDNYHSQFFEYQENKQPRKIAEQQICANTRISETKWGLSHRNPEKSGHSYIFC